MLMHVAVAGGTGASRPARAQGWQTDTTRLAATRIRRLDVSAPASFPRATVGIAGPVVVRLQPGIADERAVALADVAATARTAASPSRATRARRALLGAAIGAAALGTLTVGAVFVASGGDPTGRSRWREPVVQQAALLGAAVGAAVGARRH